MSATRWTVKVQQGDTWSVQHEGERFASAIVEYDTAPEPRKLLRNGRSLSMTDDHPNLFEETT